MDFDLFSIIESQFHRLIAEAEADYAYRLSLALNGSTGSEILLAVHHELNHPPDTLTTERCGELEVIRDQVRCLLIQSGWKLPE